MNDPDRKKSNTRFYIITIAIVIVVLGGMLIAFRGKELGVLGAGVFEESGSNLNQAEGGILSSDGATTESSAVEISGNTGGTLSSERTILAPELRTKVELDIIPVIKTETKAEDIDIKFNNLNTKIKVNKEDLQLDSIDRVDFKIHGFVGDILLNDKSISLNGKVSRLQVNGVVLSSNAIQIYFDGIKYEHFSATGMELEQLNLANGKGKMEIGNEKISYILENKDKVTLNSVFGDIMADKIGSTTFTATVTAQNIATSGAVESVFR
ncbi:hypothetical protein HZC32_01360 [Candidatus Woesearchaeota archaeon]|nr:hypothetical protein [Candidatus Woesearchaeota archaeon]